MLCQLYYPCFLFKLSLAFLQKNYFSCICKSAAKQVMPGHVLDFFHFLFSQIALFLLHLAIGVLLIDA